MKLLTHVVVMCAVLFCASPLFGQEAFYGTIVGNVTDSTEAAIPGASVTVTNVETGVDISRTADSQGFYQALNLKTGSYKVSVTVPGFKTFVRKNLVLSGGTQIRVDATMEVGEMTTTVEVTAAAPMLNTENMTTKTTGIGTHKNVTTLPYGIRANVVFPDVYYQLFEAHADVNNSGFIIGGTLSGQNGEIQDGMRIEGQPHFVGGNRGLARPGIESVEEMVVTTTSPSAKYPNPSAIELVLKSGSNDWHGSLMYVHGSKSLNAPNYFTGEKSPFILHQFFGSLGGPIVKDKTFFFFSFQGFNHPTGEVSFSSVPTPRMKTGDLGEFLEPDFLSAAGFSAPVNITDPLTGQAFPGNVIPRQRISPVANNMLQVYPTPNTDSGTAYRRNFVLTDLLIRKEDFNHTSRVDHYWSPTEHTYVRYTYFNTPNAREQYNIPGFGGNFFIVNNDIYTAHHTSTIRPNLVNHVLFGLFREDSPLGPGLFAGTEEAIPWNENLGIAGIPADQDSGFPFLSFSQTGITTPRSWGFGKYQNRIWHIRDDVSWTSGRHNIQLGVEFRRTNLGSDMRGGPRQGHGGTCQFGCLNFTGRWTGFDYGDFMLGLPNTSTRLRLQPPDFRRRDEWAFYLQDDLRVTPRLNLSLGFRYDYFGIEESNNGLATVFDPSSLRLVFPNQGSIGQIPAGVTLPVPIATAAEAGYPESLLAADKNNFGPRLGFAYRFMSDSVIRGGGGVYHSPLVGTGRRLIAGPFSATEDFPAVPPETPVLTLANPYPSGAGGTRGATVRFFGPERDARVPLHYNYNLAVERQIGNQAFTVEFVGKKSIIPWQPNLNSVPPSLNPFAASRLPFAPTVLGTVTGLANGAHYNYHALRLDARRRFAEGVFFNTTYVWASTIDDLGGIFGEAAGSSEDPFDRARDRGKNRALPSHRFTVNYLWEMPFGKKGSRFALADSEGGRVLNYIIQGWQIGGTYNFLSGFPLNFSGSYLRPLVPGADCSAHGPFDATQCEIFDAPNTGRLNGRPDMTSTPPGSPSGGIQVFNPAAFSRQVPEGRYGNVGRGLLRKFNVGTIAMHQSVFRNFWIPWFIGADRRAKLRVGFLFYNAFNHSNGRGPTTSLNSPIFGSRSRDKAGNVRTIHFQARLDF